jgi:hypothetical protein
MMIQIDPRQCLCSHACCDENGGNLTKVIHGCSHLVPCAKPNTTSRTGSFLKLVQPGYNTLGVCHSLSSGFELKHDRLSGDEDIKVKPMER